MSWMETYFMLKTIVPLIMIGFIIFCGVCYGLHEIYQHVRRRFSEGWCRHEFKLNRTLSYGPRSWYKCTKCGTEKLK